MPIELYTASVPVFLRYLERLQGLMNAAEAHVAAHALDERALLEKRLAPDMLPLETQVRIAAHFSLRTCFPLAGQPIPPYGEFPMGFDGLRECLTRASSLLRSLPVGSFVGDPSRTIESQAGEAQVRLPAAAFLLQYALPNFFFHLTVAYAILRGAGVAIGKADFDGWHHYPLPSAPTT